MDTENSVVLARGEGGVGISGDGQKRGGRETSAKVSTIKIKLKK